MDDDDSGLDLPCLLAQSLKLANPGLRATLASSGKTKKGRLFLSSDTLGREGYEAIQENARANTRLCSGGGERCLGGMGEVGEARQGLDGTCSSEKIYAEARAIRAGTRKRQGQSRGESKMGVRHGCCEMGMMDPGDVVCQNMS